jgi:HTH-type transcriptional regulator / antitoxin HigA
MIRRIGKMMIGLTSISNYYLQLISEFPPHPIKNDDELRETQKRINLILDKANFTQDDQDYLKILGMLVYDYEEKYEHFPKLESVEILQSLINEGVKSEDLLDIFVNESIISDIFNNQHKITKEEAEKLNNYAFNFFHAMI